MTYKIKPEYAHLWGEDVTENTVITEADIEMITRGWETTKEAVIDQLIPLDYESQTVYTQTSGDTTIMILEADDCYEVYYRKPQYSYEFAFGITLNHSLSEVFEMAIANIDEYADLFD